MTSKIGADRFEPSGSNRYGVVGWIATGLWIGVFGSFLVWKRIELPGLELNEWGDFLSGFVAGTAFVWIVLSFFQQADELRLNTAALRAQQEELSLQVQETRALVVQSIRQAEAAEKQAELLKVQAESIRQRARPQLMVVSVSREGQDRASAAIKNVGGRVSELRLDWCVGCMASVRDSILDSGGETTLRIHKKSPTGEPATFQLRCITTAAEWLILPFVYEGGKTLRAESPHPMYEDEETSE